MDSSRFETFIDAVLAIMMTVMILKISQPLSTDFMAIFDKWILFLAYVLSFVILFSVWDNHRKLFDIVNEIDNHVVWVYGILMFILTLVPYFTSWVAHHPYDFVPEVCFGGIFLITNFLYVLATKLVISHDKCNEELSKIKFDNLLYLNFILFVIGFVLAYIGYPFAVFIICMITVITWNLIPHIKDIYNLRGTNGN